MRLKHERRTEAFDHDSAATIRFKFLNEQLSNLQRQMEGCAHKKAILTSRQSQLRTEQLALIQTLVEKMEQTSISEVGCGSPWMRDVNLHELHQSIAQWALQPLREAISQCQSAVREHKRHKQSHFEVFHASQTFGDPHDLEDVLSASPWGLAAAAGPAEAAVHGSHGAAEAHHLASTKCSCHVEAGGSCQPADSSG